MNRRQDRFRGILNLPEQGQRQQATARPLAGNDLANLPQIHAATKVGARAHEDHGVDMGIGAGRAKRGLNPLVDFHGESVHRRVGERDHSDFIMQREIHYLAHGPPCFCARISSASAGTTSNRSPTIP